MSETKQLREAIPCCVMFLICIGPTITGQWKYQERFTYLVFVRLIRIKIKANIIISQIRYTHLFNRHDEKDADQHSEAQTYGENDF